MVRADEFIVDDFTASHGHALVWASIDEHVIAFACAHKEDPSAFADADAVGFGVGNGADWDFDGFDIGRGFSAHGMAWGLSGFFSRAGYGWARRAWRGGRRGYRASFVR